MGELQPLCYPEDVEPFIRRWFDHQPERGEDLAAQIARRPGLQQAATAPLVLAFYCIVGGREPLPDFRRDLVRQGAQPAAHAVMRPAGYIVWRNNHGYAGSLPGNRCLDPKL